MPPEFFLDRGLGRGVADGLTELGWAVHRVADHFPHVAQEIPDQQWLAYGLARGWTPLCKDGRIKGRGEERAPLLEHRAILCCLDNQRLLRAEMVDRFYRAQSRIYRAVLRGGPPTR